jgi:hypothetical protein
MGKSDGSVDGMVAPLQMIILRAVRCSGSVGHYFLENKKTPFEF